MSRITYPATVADAPAAAQPLLEGVRRQFGTVPNLFRLVGNSPAALEGHLGLFAALGKGALPARTAARIALAVAEVNGCDYCLSAHTYLGRQLAKLDDAEMAANRAGGSRDAQAEVAVRFAARVARERGRVEDADLADLRAAGYSQAQIVEIVLHVALNVFTNYLNLVAQTEIDFPHVEARQAA